MCTEKQFNEVRDLLINYFDRLGAYHFSGAFIPESDNAWTTREELKKVSLEKVKKFLES